MKRDVVLLLVVAWMTVVHAQPADYEWTSWSRNSSESMPCGGGDVGMNVWVEEGDVLLYLSRSGSFDENNTLLKQGRIRLRLSPSLSETAFRQTLCMADGYVQVTDGVSTVQLWADVGKPVVHIEVSSRKPVEVEAVYENWRTRPIPLTKRECFQTSYKFAAPKGLTTQPDRVWVDDKGVTFVHHNADETVFDATVSQQRLDAVKSQLYNPLRQLTFGGHLSGEGFTLCCTTQGRYAHTDYDGWKLSSQKPRRSHHLQVVLATTQGSIDTWRDALDQTARQVSLKRDRQASRRWWRDYWQRSFVATAAADHTPLAVAMRNYTLFRYMLGCNAHGQWPTKFNGGLFTFDPEYVNDGEEYRLSPDFRNWGGGVHTAQNQRLVYWPMLKSGDYDALQPQIDFYLRILDNACLRSQVYWHHDGACFTEQIENYGLPCLPEYGTKRPEGFDPGMERNAWLEYEWDTALEFCQMALLMDSYGGIDATPCIPLVCAVLDFFDLHYQYLANQRGAKRLDGQGRLVIYPGSGCETIKGAYNPSSTIAGLRVVTETLLRRLSQPTGTRVPHADSLTARYEGLLQRLPDIPLRDGMIAPAQLWERVQNVETPQLYPVFPWRVYGVGRPDIETARKTYAEDTLAVKHRSHVGWKQDNIWAACLGLTDEAVRLTTQKLADGPYRFPAFWGPGYDWSPDHNWGGSGMIGLQEMLLQETPDGHLLLLPAWPRTQDVHFRLHASSQTTVEAVLEKGRLTRLEVTPASRKADVIYSEP